jgi:actin beta/gamma 1
MLLKLALNRIRLHHQKKGELGQVMRREVTALIKEGKDEQARIRTVTVIHSDYYLEVLSALEVMVETVASQMEIMAAQTRCPLELKEAVCSIVYAAPFLDNAPELVKVRSMILSKYGKDFAQECVGSCCVAKKVKDGLARNMPDDALVSLYIQSMSPNPTSSSSPSRLPEPPASPSGNDVTPKQSQSPLPSQSQPIQRPQQTKSSGRGEGGGAAEVEGVIRRDQLGNHWAIVANLHASASPTNVFIPTQSLMGAASGNRVRVQLDPRTDGKFSGRVVSILSSTQSQSSSQSQSLSLASSSSSTIADLSSKSNATTAADTPTLSSSAQGIFKVDANGNSWVQLSAAQAGGTKTSLIYVAPQGRLDAKQGDLVLAQLHQRNDGKASGHVIRVIQSAQSLRQPLSASASASSSMASISSPPPSSSATMETTASLETFNVQVKILIDNDGQGHCPNNNLDALSKLPVSAGSKFVFVPRDELHGAKHGDLVVVRVDAGRRAGNGSLLGSVHHVVERANPSGSGELEGYDIHQSSSFDIIDEGESKDNKIDAGNAEPDEDLDELDAFSKTWDGGFQTSRDNISAAATDTTADKTTTPSPPSPPPSSSSLSTTVDMELELRRIVVLDVGSGMVKVGLANQSVPSYAEPTVIGYPLAGSSAGSVSNSRVAVPTTLIHGGVGGASGGSGAVIAPMIGSDALGRQSVLDIVHLMDRGSVTDWNAFKDFLKLLLEQKLKIPKANLESHAVVLTDSIGNPTATRTRLVQLLFEEPFRAGHVCVAHAPLLALSACGLRTGLVVDLGHAMTTVTPVYESMVIHSSRQQLPLAGQDITAQLGTLLSQSTGVNFVSSPSLRVAARHIKERFAYVASDLVEEKKKFNIPAAVALLRKSYMLADGSTVELTDERFLCAEILFEPGLIGLDVPGLAELIKKAVMSCDDGGVRGELLRHVLVCGGTSLLPGLSSRVQHTLSHLFPDYPIHVIDFSKRNFSTWIGGSMLASAPNLVHQLISSDDWKKQGPSIISQKLLV